MKSPVYNLKPIHIDQISPSFYTTTAMTKSKVDMLYESIKADGFTSPIVCFYSPLVDAYCIIDGYYRYEVMKQHRDIYEREGGMMPVTVIDKPTDELLLSAYRHNLSRGFPAVKFTGMIIDKLIKIGKSDDYIKRHLHIDESIIKRYRNLDNLADDFAKEALIFDSSINENEIK